MDLLERICSAELGGDIGEIGEGELAWIGTFTDTDVDNIFGDEVAGELSALCAGSQII